MNRNKINKKILIVTCFILLIITAILLIAAVISDMPEDSVPEAAQIEAVPITEVIEDEPEEETATPPSFMMLSDRKYRTGTALSLLDLVYAQDTGGMDLTDRIVIVSDGGYATDVPGDYEVTYSVTDDAGVTCEETVTVSVGDFDHNDYGFEIDREVLAFLIDHDHFDYDPLTDADAGDIDKLTLLTSPASFGAAYDDGACSCFLYKVTPDHLYFYTNKHCPVDSADTLCLYAYDDNMTEIPSSEIMYLKYHLEYDAVANGYLQYDQQLFVVPLSYFDIDELLCFKQVHVDMDAFDALEVGDMFLMNTQSWRRCQKDIVLANTVMFLDCYEQTAYHYDGDNSVPAVSHMIVGELKNAVGSCSGSPCFDRYGNFLGFIWGTTYANGPELIYLDQFVPAVYFKEFADSVEYE
ncbi:MAG: DUF5011 domain-containing protein [Lachnospiraceae bacterium]|nr:DUF5011 domain-containing protein [Lachnospiraceae bacterium]